MDIHGSYVGGRGAQLSAAIQRRTNLGKGGAQLSSAN